MFYRRTALAGITLAASLCTVGCDSTGLSAVNGLPTPDLAMLPAVPDLADPPPDMTAPFPAPFPDPPQVVQGMGPVLKAPKLVPVFFSNEDPGLVRQLTDFLNIIGASKYWTATTSEYGVGPATSTMPVMLAETATGTISDAQIQKWLLGKLNGNDPLFPADDENTLYVLHYPAGVTITLPGGRNGVSKSCQSFGGYHSNTRVDLAHHSYYAAYAVIPQCGKGVDSMTQPESHELIEAATDPYPQSTPAFYTVDDDHSYYGIVFGGAEVGDMCEHVSGIYSRFVDLPYSVQRTWSNAAALAGHNPCVPAPAGVTVGALPEVSDSVTIFNSAAIGVLVPVGMSKTIVLDLFSDSNTGGPFSVSVAPYGGFGGGANVNYSLDKDQGVNGDKVNLTIEVTAAPRAGFNVFEVTATNETGAHSWLGLVGQM